MSVERLVAWLRSEGADVDPGLRAVERAGRGMCLVLEPAGAVGGAVGGGPRDEAVAVLGIPRRCILTPQVALEDATLGPALRHVTREPGPRGEPPLALPWAPIVWLARARFASAEAPGSALAPWVEALPPAFAEFPLYWDADEAACLAGTPLLDALRVLATSLADALVRVREALAERGGGGEAGRAAWLSEGNLKWATCCFWSRVLGLPADAFDASRGGGSEGEGDVVLAMVPLLDFANHSGRGGTATWSVERVADGGEPMAVLWARRAATTSEGVELTFSYGEEKVNDVLLLSYGFLDEEGAGLLDSPPGEASAPGPSDAVYLPLDALDTVLAQEDPALARAKVATIRRLTNCLRLYPLHPPTSAALVTAVLTPEALAAPEAAVRPDPMTRKRAESVERWLLEGVLENLGSAAIEFEPSAWPQLPRNVRAAIRYKAGVMAAAKAALAALAARAHVASAADAGAP